MGGVLVNNSNSCFLYSQCNLPIRKYALIAIRDKR